MSATQCCPRDSPIPATSLAAPDPVDDNGFTPLCAASHRGLAEVVVALLDAGANVDFATPPQHVNYAGFTPLMYAVDQNHAGLAKLLLKRGADGTKTSSEAFEGIDAGSIALGIARFHAGHDADCTETFEVLRRRCCSMCGVTSSGLCTMTASEEQHLKRCGSCPARGPRAQYCSKACQRADWVSRHRGECAEVRRARQAAGTEV